MFEFLFFEENKAGMNIKQNIDYLEQSFNEMAKKGFEYKDQLKLKSGILFIFQGDKSCQKSKTKKQ